MLKHVARKTSSKPASWYAFAMRMTARAQSLPNVVETKDQHSGMRDIAASLESVGGEYVVQLSQARAPRCS